MKFFFPIVFIFFITGCHERKMSITKTGDFMFRRSYAAIQVRDVSNEESDSIEKSNPWLANSAYSQKDSSLMHHLRKVGILDSSFDLIRGKFPEMVPHQFTLTNKNGEQLHGSFIHRPPNETTDLYNLVLADKKHEIAYELEEHYGALNRDISYLLLDLIPGGFPEIVILHEYYISNGDNSNIMIYEVTY